jgi:hypothetical protein
MTEEVRFSPPADAGTEELAYFALAWMWNRLEPEPFFELLSPDVVWESQNVFTPWRGRATVIEYLRGKMEALRAARPVYRLFAELGRCGDERRGRVSLLGWVVGTPCVLTYQDEDVDRGEPSGLALIQVKDGLIVRVDLCTVVPDPSSAERTGTFPGLPGSPFVH